MKRIFKILAAFVLLAVGETATENVTVSSAMTTSSLSAPQTFHVLATKVPYRDCRECYNEYPYIYDGDGNVYGLSGAPCTSSAGLAPPLYCARCDFGDCNGWGWYTATCQEALCTFGHDEDEELLVSAAASEDVEALSNMILSHRVYLSTSSKGSELQVFGCDGIAQLSLAVAPQLDAAIRRNVSTIENLQSMTNN